MASRSTTKKTTAGAKKTTSTAAKKTTVAKAAAPKTTPKKASVEEFELKEDVILPPIQPAPAAEASAAAEKPKTLEDFERNAAFEARKAADNVRAQMKDDDLVTIQVPQDPRGEILVFHRSFNGVEVKLKAGEIREMPRFLASAVMKCMRLQILSDKMADAYTKGSGKDLTNML